MDPIHRLEEIFARFPGIGPRQARRFVYHILNKPASFIKEFTSLVEEVKRSTSECGECHRIYMNADSRSDGRLCPICSDPSRDRSTLMVVARDSDIETVEKSGAYSGVYFVLGGTVPILDKEPDKRIRLQEFLERITDPASVTAALKEIILSLNATPEGEHTARIVKDAATKVLERGGGGRDTSGANGAASKIKITVLGRGLSTGAELEYVDGDTIKNALENRH